MIRIQLPDKSFKEFPHEPTVLDVAKAIGPRLAQDTVGGLINDETEVTDLRRKLKNNDRLKIVTVKDPLSLEVIRHSSAHLMAQAVQELWPDVKVTIGPVIDNGFFYDFDSPRPFMPEDLEKIEARMKEIIGRNLEVVREDWPKQKAIETFKKMGERFKVEIIQDLNEDSVGIYKQGDQWFDLCRGPHVQNLNQIKAVKVLHTAGAYWRGDEKNPQLQRIYATAFMSEKDMAEHLKNLEEAKLRDHRKIGKELDLFYFHQYSPGAPFYLPKGAVIYNELLAYIRSKYHKHDYHEVVTPQIFDTELFKTSGHIANYKDNMYFTKFEERDFGCKPMNCPGHCLLYGAGKKSYRELPWRIADFGRLHRAERSGALHGMMRVRSFSQDDAHIFCRRDQVQQEIMNFIQFLDEVYKDLGMEEYIIYLSTRPEKRMGSDEVWDWAEGTLRQALDALGRPYKLNPADGAFYGPKLDIMFVDSIKRPWQLGTLQVDPNLPQVFELGFVGEDNKEHRPVMLHRAIFGSLERFIGVYIEHVAGKFPAWLAPVQTVIMNITTKQEGFCTELAQKMKNEGLRASLDLRNEKLGFKIREAQLQKIPYMLTVGDREMETNSVSVRMLNGEQIASINADEFIKKLKLEVQNRNFQSTFSTGKPVENKNKP